MPLPWSLCASVPLCLSPPSHPPSAALTPQALQRFGLEGLHSAQPGTLQGWHEPSLSLTVFVGHAGADVAFEVRHEDDWQLQVCASEGAASARRSAGARSQMRTARRMFFTAAESGSLPRTRRRKMARAVAHILGNSFETRCSSVGVSLARGGLGAQPAR